MNLFSESVFTVSELTSAIKGVLEPTFRQVAVRGEISNFKPAASGHLYFSLKDDESLLSVAAFGAIRKPWREHLREGEEVLCFGRLSLYAPRGSYQLIVEHVEPQGRGALQIQFERLKAKLLREGLFSDDVKRALPSFPRRIAVVTSPTGAAIHDFLTVLKRRAPHVEVVVVPAIVQGDQAAPSLIQALKDAERFCLGEVIVLARGGGSFEDLFAFNDEALARAIRASSVPVVSAVGHEVDFSIADFVSDLRAPTPTAAAEILTVHWVRELDHLRHSARLLQGLIRGDLERNRQRLHLLRAKLRSPVERLREQAQRLDELDRRLRDSIRNLFFRLQQRLENRAEKLDALSPLKVLSRGYALVLDENTKVVSSAQSLRAGLRLVLRFADGSCSATTDGDPSHELHVGRDDRAR